MLPSLLAVYSCLLQTCMMWTILSSSYYRELLCLLQSFPSPTGSCVYTYSTFIHVCTHIHTVHGHMYTLTHIHTYTVLVHIYMSTHTNVHMYMHTRTCRRAHTHIWTHICKPCSPQWSWRLKPGTQSARPNTHPASLFLGNNRFFGHQQWQVFYHLITPIPSSETGLDIYLSLAWNLNLFCPCVPGILSLCNPAQYFLGIIDI